MRSLFERAEDECPPERLKTSERTALALLTAASLLPLLLILWRGAPTSLGWNELSKQLPGPRAELTIPKLIALLRGSTLHNLLEWSVVCVALCTAILAFVHFRKKRRALSPIISMGAVSSASITGFHALATSGLIFAVVSLERFVPFAFAVGQAFTALVFLTTAFLVLIKRSRDGPAHLGVPVVVGMSLLFVALAFGLIYLLAAAPQLPQVLWPTGWIKRPWDLVALVLFLIGLVVVFPRLHRREQSRFSFALWLSAVPFIAGQAYALNSAQLYDDFFYASQIMKLVGFLVIFAGLVQDYAWHCQEEGILRERLQRRTRQVQLLADNAFEAIIVFNEERHILAANARAVEIFGWAPGEALDQDVVKAITAPDDGESLGRWLDAIIADERADGFAPPRVVESLRRTGDDGERFPGEVTVMWAQEEDQRLLAILIRDISEMRELQTRMIQSERLAAIGTLAAGIAHEINNPLAYAMSNVDFGVEQLHELVPVMERLLEVCAGEELRAPRETIADTITELRDLQSALQTASGGAERVRRIIDDLRVLSRAGGEETHPVNVVDALHAALRMTRHKIDAVARLVVTTEDVPRVEADEPRLTQVLVNLLLNATQALETRPRSENQIEVRVFPQPPRVVVEIADNGPGIPPALQDRIFDPFFTTKPVGEGTGLGLSLARTIVEDYSGHLTVQSQPDQQTVFRLELPVCGDRSGGFSR